MFFRRRLGRDDAWAGTVAGKRRRIGPDGQYVIYRVTVTLADGTVREIRVRRALWKTLATGDRLVKQPGQRAPVKAG